jgi:hypothetical protein
MPCLKGINWFKEDDDSIVLRNIYSQFQQEALQKYG